MPKEEQYGGIADQLRRSSKSICANLVEGFAKRHLSGAEFKRFLMIAFGSCEETRLWLRYARDLSFIQKEQFENLDGEYLQITKMMYALHRCWK